jgi:hypothetical protein
MVRVFVFLAAVQLVLVVLALISVLSADRVRTMPRALWIVVILLVPLIGPVAYALAGRPAAPTSGVRPRPAARPAAPDDDPEFLKGLDPDKSRRDRELFETWERDMKRQSDDAARRDLAARDQSTRDQSTRDQSTRDEVAKEQAARDEAARRDATRKDETPPTEV